MNTLALLQGAGWVTDPKEIFRSLFAHALVTDHSQSNIYRGTIISIPYIIAQYENNPLALSREMTDALTIYYERYFTGVVIDVTYGDVIDTEYELKISISVTVSGELLEMAVVGNIKNGMLYDVFQGLNDD